MYMYIYAPPPSFPPPTACDTQGFYTTRKTWFAADVCHMLEEYVRVSGIRPYVRLQQELVDQAWDKAEGEDGMWTLKARGEYIVWSGLCIGIMRVVDRFCVVGFIDWVMVIAEPSWLG